MIQETRSILIVDDEVDHLHLLGDMLESHYQVIGAQSLSETLRLLERTTAPDLILLPLKEPEPQGDDGLHLFERVCEHIRETPALKDIPVIFVCDDHSPLAVSRALALGAVDVITRPVESALLLSRVRAQLAFARERKLGETSTASRAQELLAQTSILCLDTALDGRERAEIALRESQARFDRLTAGLKDSLFVFATTTAGEILYLSDGYRLLGKERPERELGQHWQHLADWTSESVNTLLDRFTRLLTGELERSNFELAYHHPNGSQHHLAIHAYRIHSEERDGDFIEGIALDITERKAFEARLRNLQRAMDQAPVSILITDADSKIEYVNPFFCQITGYAPEEVLGQTPQLFKSGEHPDAIYQVLWETLKRGETWRGDLVNKRKDGRLYWESVTISPIRNERGRTVNFLGVKENIDDRKELERIKEDVERMMRHDLKNPLNAVQALPELLLLDDNLTEDQRDSLTVIQEGARKMRDLIDLSLDLFKMETGQFNYRPQTLNLLPILRQVIRLTRTRAEDRALRICYRLDGADLDGEPPPDQPIYLQADARLLSSMLSNLIANAIDASPTGEQVMLALDQGDPLRLSIINQGVVPTAIRAHFFEKYRTHGKQGGTGLGTYSAKLMATTMDYDIRMETSDVDNCTHIQLAMPAGHLSRQ